MGVKYYGTERPLSLGSYPKNENFEKVNNFDEKTFCEEIGREAYGYVEYSEPLDKEEAKAYELVKEGIKKYYSVTSTFDDKGNTTARITSSKEAEEQPENRYKRTSTKDLYMDWFDSYEKAEEFVNYLLNENSREDKSREDCNLEY